MSKAVPLEKLRTLFDALATVRLLRRYHGGDGTVRVNMRTLYRRHLSIIGGTGASTAMIREVFAAVADGAIAPPPVFHRVPLEEVAAAHEAALGRDLFGRVVLTVGA